MKRFVVRTGMFHRTLDREGARGTDRRGDSVGGDLGECEHERAVDHLRERPSTAGEQGRSKKAVKKGGEKGQ